MQRRNFLTLAGAGGALALTSAPFVARSAAAQETFKWRMANLYREVADPRHTGIATR